MATLFGALFALPGRLGRAGDSSMRCGMGLAVGGTARVDGSGAASAVSDVACVPAPSGPKAAVAPSVDEAVAVEGEGEGEGEGGRSLVVTGGATSALGDGETAPEAPGSCRLSGKPTTTSAKAAATAIDAAPRTHRRAEVAPPSARSCASSCRDCATSGGSESQVGASLAACSDASSRKTGKKLGYAERLDDSLSVRTDSWSGAGSSNGSFVGSVFSQYQHAVAFTALDALQAGQDTRYLLRASSV
jgi:hypothetical protein